MSRAHVPQTTNMDGTTRGHGHRPYQCDGTTDHAPFGRGDEPLATSRARPACGLGGEGRFGYRQHEGLASFVLFYDFFVHFFRDYEYGTDLYAESGAKMSSNRRV